MREALIAKDTSEGPLLEDTEEVLKTSLESMKQLVPLLEGIDMLVGFLQRVDRVFHRVCHPMKEKDGAGDSDFVNRNCLHAFLKVFVGQSIFEPGTMVPPLQEGIYVSRMAQCMAQILGLQRFAVPRALARELLKHLEREIQKCQPYRRERLERCLDSSSLNNFCDLLWCVEEDPSRHKEITQVKTILVLQHVMVTTHC